jgi:hypothetical protein
MWLFFRPFFSSFPSAVWFDFVYRVFGRFVTRGVQKRDKQKSRENILSSQKKQLLTSVTFFFFAAPLGFRHGLFVNTHFDGVLELPSPLTEKRPKTHYFLPKKECVGTSRI